MASRAKRLVVYDVSAIPDCDDHRLVTLCGGAVRERVYRGFEYLLRMIASFEDGQVALTLRYQFDPANSGGIQDRLRLQVAMKVRDGVSHEIVRQLVEVGPLCEFYEFGSPSSVKELELSDFPFACEIIRQEDRVETQLPREMNRFVPRSGFYYSPTTFLARQDNDYLSIDAMLSRMSEPCSLELLVTSVDHEPDRQAHEQYLRQVMAINDYGENLLANPLSRDSSVGFLGDDHDDSPVMEDVRKRDPTADDILQEQQDFHAQLRQPQLLFNVKAFAMKPEMALMLASAAAEAGLSEGRYRHIAFTIDSNGAGRKWLSSSLEDTRRMDISLHARYSGIWDQGLPETWEPLQRLSRLASVGELEGLLRFPVGGHNSPRCIRKSTDPDAKEQDAQASILIGDDLESGKPQPRKTPSNLDEMFLCNRPANLELRLGQKALTKHMFIAGVPGSGKTTAVHNILVQLCRQGIPFLVLEPAKTEYRALKVLSNHPDPSVKKMAKDIRVYTPGNDEVSPLRFNPLAYPKGITLDEHIGQVLACFEAAMPMGGPLQALIAEAVEEVYAGSGDDDFPRMVDLLQAADRTMESKNYEGEIRSNLRAAIQVRLGLLTRRAMGRIFSAPRSVPSANDLLTYPTIIEMDYLPQDHACLLTLFLLTSLREQIRIDPDRRKGGLHHGTVIEEAHNIVGRTGAAKASEDITDPKSFAAQYISRMLAELRALGEGIIVADQLPSAVAPEVVKNTGTKLAHRLVSNQDREDLGGTMLMGSVEIEELARMSVGEAYFYTEGLHRPRRVRCLNSAAYLDLEDRALPVGADIIPYLEGDQWFIDARSARARMAVDGLLRRQSEISSRIEATKTELKGWVERFKDAVGHLDAKDMKDELEEIKYLILLSRDELEQLIEVEYPEMADPVIRQIEQAEGVSKPARELLEKAKAQFGSLVVRDYEALLHCLGQLEDKVDEVLLKRQRKG